MSLHVSFLACTLIGMATFEQFWAKYPRKTGKGAAERSWQRAIRKADSDTILAALEAHLAPWATYEPQFIPYPATWLNGGRWDDEPPVARAARPMTRAEQARETTRWFEERDRKQGELE